MVLMEIYLIYRMKSEREIQSFEVMKEGWSVDSWEGGDEVLKKGEGIPPEKHGLQSFALIIADSRPATPPA